MSLATPVAPVHARAGEPIRVMIVDDSAVVRGLVSRWLREEPGLEVVASLRTGLEAVDQLECARPDVVLLDVDMPDLDGLAALPRLLAKDRNLTVVMASTLTRPGAEASLKALSLGATDYIPKPNSGGGIANAVDFRRDLVGKVRHLGARRARLARLRGAGREARPFRAEISRIAAAPTIATAPAINLRPFGHAAPRVLLIGASTGGPQALDAVVTQLHSVIDRAAVLITQHMPPTFTTILAEHLARASGRPAREAVDGEPIVPGRIYVAPGGRHMQAARVGNTPVVALDDGPPVNFCRPAVDPLFCSAARIWRPSSLAVVLTGMGADGTGGAADIVAAGGSVIAQDEATSVVWGMPGAAAHAGLCSAVLPLAEIAPRIVRLFAGDRT